MGEFLAQKATSLRPPDHIIRIRRRASAFLESKGDIDRALEQLAASADWPGMAALIKRHGDRYFLQIGRLDALRSWLGRLPEEVVAATPGLCIFKE